MAFERQDMSRLMRMVTAGTITLKQANRFAALPLMIIPSKVHTKIEGWKNFNVGKFHFIPSIQRFMLHELMVLFGTKDEGIERYAYIRIINDTDYLVRLQVSENAIIEASLKYNEELRAMGINVTKINDVPIAESSGIRNLTPERAQQIKTDCAVAVAMLQLWCEFNNRRDHFMVSTEKIDEVTIIDPTGDNHPTECKTSGGVSKPKSPFGPTIIYLDQPTLASGGTHMRGEGIVMPHVRRGHFVTLRAERYKNHPLFRKYKAAYRKPAYVGDRRFIRNGTVYTVLD